MGVEGTELKGQDARSIFEIAVEGPKSADRNWGGEEYCERGAELFREWKGATMKQRDDANEDREKGARFRPQTPLWSCVPCLAVAWKSKEDTSPICCPEAPGAGEEEHPPLGVASGRWRPHKAAMFSGRRVKRILWEKAEDTRCSWGHGGRVWERDVRGEVSSDA